MRAAGIAGGLAVVLTLPAVLAVHPGPWDWSGGYTHRWEHGYSNNFADMHAYEDGRLVAVQIRAYEQEGRIVPDTTYRFRGAVAPDGSVQGEYRCNDDAWSGRWQGRLDPETREGGGSWSCPGGSPGTWRMTPLQRGPAPTMGACDLLQLVPTMPPAPDPRLGIFTDGNASARLDARWAGSVPARLDLEVAPPGPGLVASFAFDSLALSGPRTSLLLDVTATRAAPGNYPVTVRGTVDDPRRAAPCTASTELTVVVKARGSEIAPYLPLAPPTLARIQGPVEVLDARTGARAPAAAGGALRHADELRVPPGGRATLAGGAQVVDVGPGTTVRLLALESVEAGPGDRAMRIVAPPEPCRGVVPKPDFCWPPDEGLVNLGLGPLEILVEGPKLGIQWALRGGAQVFKKGLVWFAQGAIHVNEARYEEGWQPEPSDGGDPGPLRPGAVVTREALALPNGTEYAVEAGPEGTTVSVYRGEVAVYPREDREHGYLVRPGQSVRIAPGGAATWGQASLAAPWWSPAPASPELTDEMRTGAVLVGLLAIAAANLGAPRYFRRRGGAVVALAGVGLMGLGLSIMERPLGAALLAVGSTALVLVAPAVGAYRMVQDRRARQAAQAAPPAPPPTEPQPPAPPPTEPPT